SVDVTCGSTDLDIIFRGGANVGKYIALNDISIKEISMAFPVKTQLANDQLNAQGELAARVAENIVAEVGEALFSADPKTGYVGSANIITEIVACMIQRDDCNMTDAALANIVTACTSA
ncbi:MAG: hypothetical protein DRP56_10670, partial [Planctomycetota bacterium]